MGNYEHLKSFAGRPVEDWDPEEGIQDPLNVIYRLRLDVEELHTGASWANLFTGFLEDPASIRLRLRFRVW